MSLTNNIWDLYKDIKQSLSSTDVVTECISKESCCSSSDLISSGGMMVCRSCGKNCGGVLEYGSEWRYYGGSDNRYKGDPSRCGGIINPLLPNTSFNTYISGNGWEYFRKCH